MKYKFNYYYKLNWFYGSFLKEHKLKASEISLFLAILHFSNNNVNNLKPRYADLVKLAGVSKNCIKKNIDKLLELKLINKDLKIIEDCNSSYSTTNTEKKNNSYTENSTCSYEKKTNNNYYNTKFYDDVFSIKM